MPENRAKAVGGRTAQVAFGNYQVEHRARELTRFAHGFGNCFHIERADHSASPFRVLDKGDADSNHAPIGWHAGETNIALIDVVKLAACWTESARRKSNAPEHERCAVKSLNHSPMGARQC